MNDFFFVIALASVVEAVPMHLLLGVWSARIAWVVTSLSLYGAIWMYAMSRAFALRPLLVSSDAILVRYGLLLTLRIPVDRIKFVKPGCDAPAAVTALPRGTQPAIYIEFTEPLRAATVMGFAKPIAGIGLRADDAAGFASALTQVAGHSCILPVENNLP